ncbi:hypothetical protein M422DRAFT_262148 [Sphaerobolus stellatus SS14]|uniref:SAP domain-containing protein n=1 Tax=Sphaerobolus stellatus (strain SS14) TaxID=990650 RepID=A0A0C9VDS1_SPHS4|nr:hypothetical protein M422DRAFT_262148 [Sphaerobolus stellatus SS14]
MPANKIKCSQPPDSLTTSHLRSQTKKRWIEAGSSASSFPSRQAQLLKDERSAYEARMQLAMKEFHEGKPGATQRALATKYDVKYWTLWCRLLGVPTWSEGHFKQQTLNKEQADTLIQYCQLQASQARPLTHLHLKQKVFMLVRRTPSDKWVSQFLRARPDVLTGKGHGLDPKRGESFRKDIVYDYFDKLEKIDAAANGDVVPPGFILPAGDLQDFSHVPGVGWPYNSYATTNGCRCFRSLQIAWGKHCIDLACRGQSVTQDTVIEEYMKIRNKYFTKAVVAHAFRKSGCWPINRHVFSDEDFAPMEFTDGGSEAESEDDNDATWRDLSDCRSDSRSIITSNDLEDLWASIDVEADQTSDDELMGRENSLLASRTQASSNSFLNRLEASQSMLSELQCTLVQIILFQLNPHSVDQPLHEPHLHRHSMDAMMLPVTPDSKTFKVILLFRAIKLHPYRSKFQSLANQRLKGAHNMIQQKIADSKKKAEVEEAAKQAKEAATRERELERALNVATKAFDKPLMSLKKDELKDLASALGLSQDGINKVLIDRIKQKFEGNPLLKEDIRFKEIFTQKRGRKRAIQEIDEEGELEDELEGPGLEAGPSGVDVTEQFNFPLDPALQYE